MKLRTLCAFSAALLAASSAATAAGAAMPPQEASFDAARAEPFRQKNEKYKTLDKEGKAPGPWQMGAWADGAVAETALVKDGGDGKPAFRMVNVSGRPSAMFKPWKDLTLERGTWEARAEYRKAGKTPGRLVLSGPGNKEVSVELAPTGDGFQTVSLPVEVTAQSADYRPTFQLYNGTGEGEALYLRSFRLERTGGVSATTTAAEQQAAAARDAAAQAVAVREAARRVAEKRPINGWVRPEAKPVPMTKPLAPPPITGKTYFVAPNGDDKAGDGSKARPWRSIQAGMDRLQPGDCLYLRGGEYRESMLKFPRSGKPDAYITVAGHPGETAKIVNPGGLAVFNLDAGSRWAGTNLEERAYLVIRDLHIDAGNGNQAVRISGPMQLEEYKGDLAKSRGLRHNIWVAGCDITGGNGNESVLGAGYGAHDVVISNNRVHDMVGGMNAYLFSDGTIVEWNTVVNTSRDQDDAGAIKSMAPGVIIRYNTVHGNRRSPTSKKPGWAPASEGGKQWRFLQGISGIYCDWAMVSDKNNVYPEALKPADPANYVYGNTVYDNDAGIFAFLSDNVQIFDNVVYGNGRNGSGGWAEGTEGGKWLEFVGPAGYGIRVTGSKHARVFRNVSYDNRNAGLALSGGSDVQAWNNVFFGNDLAQVHLQKGEEFALGFNRILAAGKQGPPILRNKDGFATPAAFRQKFPYQDEGTEVVALAAGRPPLAEAERVRKNPPASDAVWQAAYRRLSARAAEAGVGKPAETVARAPFDPSGGLQQPLPKALPGTVEFENYDVGGPGVSFHDDDGENEGGHYRKDAVDIKASPKAGNGAVVGFTKDGEWMEYTVSVEKAGGYPLALTYATPGKGRRIRLTLNGKPLGGPIALEPTAGWDDLRTVLVGRVSLPAGDGVLRVLIENGPVDLDRMEFRPAER